MDLVYTFLAHYWGLIALFLFGAIYTVTHFKVAVSFARNKAIVLMLSAEANAEKLALETGKQRFAWVIDRGYDLLPPIVRMVVGKPLFSTIVQSLFDEALAFAKAHAHEIVQPTPVVTPVSVAVNQPDQVTPVPPITLP